MFFHPQQGQHESSINASVTNYGFPKIVEKQNLLQIGIGEQQVQTLYAFIRHGETPELAGAVVYTRVNTDTLAIVHLAVKAEYSFSAGYRNELVLVRMLIQVRAIAKRIKGIKNIAIAYAGKIEPRAPINV